MFSIIAEFFSQKLTKSVYNCVMRYVVGIILFFVLMACSSSLEASEGVTPSSAPEAEYMVALIDTTSPGMIKARIFVAFSSKNSSNIPESFIFKGLNRKNVSTCSLTDYVFFDVRFVKQLEKKFQDNARIKSERDNFNQQVENTNIFLFQQPFWMIHLAFKLPTALLEWHLSMKKKQPAQDFWAHIYSAEQQDLPDDINFESAGESNSSLKISYYLSGQTDMFSSRGVMFTYTESFRNDDERLDIVNRILAGEIIHEDSGMTIAFPLTRAYIINKANSSGLRISPVDGVQLDEVSLINRVNAREKGVFYSSDGVIAFFDMINSDGAVQKYSLFKQPSSGIPFQIEIAGTLDESTGFYQHESELSRIKRFTSLIRTILTGLILWILFFTLFHRLLLVGLGFWKIIRISLFAYFVYVLISTVFSFMFGFGFVLGIIAMVSATRRFIGECSTSRLFMYGLLTSFFTALSAYLLI
ncbi:hypothetical protein J7L05_06200 [bacterium]|nr:hypothetical protein [bacterium]